MIKVLIVGLGNPGKEYTNTPHNIGFAVIDALVSTFQAPALKSDTKFLCESSQIEDILLVKPQTFMNRSGACVAKLAQYYKVPPEMIFIIHDDISLPLGQLKISQDRGAANHNGVLSIIDALHTTDFPRFRLGVDTQSNLPLAKYVLLPFEPSLLPKVDELIDSTTQAVQLALDTNIATAMNNFN
jgi:peptidyl-tRNA hydrolase, PTH1 family